MNENKTPDDPYEDPLEDEGGDEFFDDLGLPLEDLQTSNEATDAGGGIRQEEGSDSGPESVIAPGGEDMRQLLDGIENLKQMFVDRLQNDAHKDKIIDQLHQELQGYKSNLVQKHIQSIIVDIIKIIDDIRKACNYYHAKDREDLDPQKIMDVLESIPSDLEDVFAFQGIQTYTCDQAMFDPTRQRVIKKIETRDAGLDKTVARSLRPGYEWEGRVIRPEMVAVYVYSQPTDNSNGDASNE